MEHERQTGFPNFSKNIFKNFKRKLTLNSDLDIWHMLQILKIRKYFVLSC